MQHTLDNKGLSLERISKGDYLIFGEKRVELVESVYPKEGELHTQRLVLNSKDAPDILPYLILGIGYKPGKEGIKKDCKPRAIMDLSLTRQELAQMQENNDPAIKTIPQSVLEAAK